MGCISNEAGKNDLIIKSKNNLESSKENNNDIIEGS